MRKSKLKSVVMGTIKATWAFMLVLMLTIGVLPGVHAAETNNTLLSVGIDKKTEAPTVLIKTKNPVGYRYTVYDSFDPIRVVIDFPGMILGDVQDSIKVNADGIKEILTSAFELSSGALARVEILLAAAGGYSVDVAADDFKVTFADGESAGSKVAAVKPVAKEPALAPVAVPMAKGAAQNILSLDLAEGLATISADGRIDTYQYFQLGDPPRLVVDVYQVQAAFKSRSFDVSSGFEKIRVGTYQDKVRFVLDSASDELPDHTVSNDDNKVIVNWESNLAKQPAVAVADIPKPAPTKTPVVAAKKTKPTVAAMDDKPQPLAKVDVQAVDFLSEEGVSVIQLELSKPAEVSNPVLDGDLIRFEIKNADISRSLRRTLDAFAFPSSVSSITPYIVAENDTTNVRIAIKLKGSVPYALEKEGALVRLIVENGSFAEPDSPAVSQVEIVAPKTIAPIDPSASMMRPAAVSQNSAGVVPLAFESFSTADQRVYSGQRISLVFDDANIRSILQLIGEVSNLNILASDGVDGTITLRLVDVPWDQALDLILETKDLGMIKEGNVARILPKNEIRSQAEARVTASRQMENLEDLVTEVIPISYTGVNNVSGPAGELLTERGSITEDSRNKQIIVSDVPKVIVEIKKLVAILDTPERQVQIEARIVEASTNWSRELGINWNFTYQGEQDASGLSELSNASTSLGGSFLINPSIGAAGFANQLTFGKGSSTVLDVQISALEVAGQGKIISTPKVTTLNGQTAIISQGTKIPYQTTSDAGTETQFESAELKLEVTPEINPDGSIILKVNASNSSQGSVVPTGLGSAPAIDEKKAETTVLVQDGETTVIGGIFVESELEAETGVPILMDIPYLGHLFKSTTKSTERKELLIFITPRILS